MEREHSIPIEGITSYSDYFQTSPNKLYTLAYHSNYEIKMSIYEAQ